MSDDTKITVWICLGFTIVFCATAGVCAVTKVATRTNTMEDEAKISEAVKLRVGPSEAYWSDTRQKVIDENYTNIEYPGLNQTSVKVFFILAGIPASIISFIMVSWLFSQLNIGTYFAAKAKTETEKEKHYKKTLDELIRIQEKISRENDDV